MIHTSEVTSNKDNKDIILNKKDECKKIDDKNHINIIMKILKI